MFKAIFTLNEILIDFFDELKTITSVYARWKHKNIESKE
jgi:translation elongation factor EF-4